MLNTKLTNQLNNIFVTVFTGEEIHIPRYLILYALLLSNKSVLFENKCWYHTFENKQIRFDAPTP